MTTYRVTFTNTGTEVYPNLDDYPEDKSNVISLALEKVAVDTDFDRFSIEVLYDFDPVLESLFRTEKDIFDRLNGVKRYAND